MARIFGYDEDNITDDEFYHRFAKTYTDITNAGTAPWMSEELPERGLAYNPKSGVIFKGVNSLMLEMSAAKQGLKDSRWMSMQEIYELGMHPKKGSMPTPIAYINHYVAPVNVNPVNGENFSRDNPKKKYYLMFNIEQLMDCELGKDLNTPYHKEVLKDKIKNLIENSKTNKIMVIREKLNDQIRNVPPQMRVLAAGLVQYRLSQELRIPNKSPVTAEKLSVYKGMQFNSSEKLTAALLQTCYESEVVKDRALSKDEQLETGLTRTVVKEKSLMRKNTKEMEME